MYIYKNYYYIYTIILILEAIIYWVIAKVPNIKTQVVIWHV